MKFDQLEFDETKIQISLTHRQKIMIYIMSIILQIVAPIKYGHQLKNFMDEILKD